MGFLKCGLATIALLLAACTAPQPERFSASAPKATESVGIAFRSVEVLDVSLPTYAAAEEITTQGAGGRLTADTEAFWADSPERSISLALTRNLVELTGARVASEPWPFETPPEARLDIRFESLVAQSNGQFIASGQYFIGVIEDIDVADREDGGEPVTRRNRENAGLFSLDVPFDPAGGPSAIAAARGQVVLQLATLIARKGLR
ncbi:PqiC family protein [Rhodobacteraceae bacterium]|nr:PqiC family protein [Paracoccaceae bacterium]